MPSEEPLLSPPGLPEVDSEPRLRDRCCSGVSEYETRVIVSGRRANIASCVLNLVLCQLGLGGLTLPNTFAVIGWLQGTLMLILFAIASSFGMYLLDQACRALPSKTDSSSVATLVAAFFGAGGAYALELLMGLLSFGALVSYMGTIGVQLREVLLAFFQPLPTSRFDGAFSVVNLSVFFAVLVIFPISLLPESITRGSLVGLVANACMLVIMAAIALSVPWIAAWPPVDACAEELPLQTEPVAWISSVAGLLRVAPMFIFSYNGPTGFLPIRAQLWRPGCDPSREVGRRKVFAFIAFGQGVVLINYVLTCWMGYMTFCASTPVNVLDGYAASMRMPEVARVALAVQLSCGCIGVWIPLCRASVWSLARGLHEPMPPTVQFAMTALCVAAPTVVSVLLGGSLALPLGLTSSVCLTTFMFVLPGLVAFQACALGPGVVARGVPLLFAIFGFCVAVVSTIDLLAG